MTSSPPAQVVGRGVLIFKRSDGVEQAKAFAKRPEKLKKALGAGMSVVILPEKNRKNGVVTTSIYINFVIW